MALVGPLTSAALGTACLLLRPIAGAASSPAYTILSWLGYINLGLAGFNMVPGYPLDGGRILRAALWWKSGNLEHATRQAALVGKFVGGLFITVGIVQFFGGGGFSGLWIAFVGWFLLQAASESILDAGIAHVLEGATAAQVMTPDCPAVSGNLNLQHFVEDRLLRTGDRCFMVMDNDELVGLVTAHEIKIVNRARWPFMTVFDVMRPISEIRTIQPGTSLKAALEIMSRENLNQLPVVKNDHVEGVLTRSRLLSFLHNRLELQS
jgi:CBS domain-containing protein